jgi:hypothetical protein
MSGLARVSRSKGVLVDSFAECAFIERIESMKNPVLRQWKDSDLEPFAQMNGDSEVMR